MTMRILGISNARWPSSSVSTYTSYSQWRAGSGPSYCLWSTGAGMVLLAVWVATVIFLYLHEREWGFALIVGLGLFLAQAFITFHG
jgi:hypothetical protein